MVSVGIKRYGTCMVPTARYIVHVLGRYESDMMPGVVCVIWSSMVCVSIVWCQVWHW